MEHEPLTDEEGRDIAIIIGVLIAIPQDTVPHYGRLAQDRQQEIADVIAEDIRTICNRHFQALRVAREEASRS